MPRIFNTRDENIVGIVRKFRQDRLAGDSRIAGEVDMIIAAIRTRGDDALYEFARKFDDHGAETGRLTIRQDQYDKYSSSVDTDLAEAMVAAAHRIREYHLRQLPEDTSWSDEHGNRLGWKWHPVASSGHYVPGGTAVYPSSVLMGAIPARVAGVGRIVMSSPMGARPNCAVVLAAKLSGIDCIYRLGGAHAIAALALGTESVEAVDMVCGPGNRYVTEAKRQLYGHVGIDMIAGPSELVVICDHHANSEWVAADLIAQAEHDSVACPVLVTTSRIKAHEVMDTVEAQLSSLPRATIARASWNDHGIILVTRDIEEGIEVANMLAPEHVEIMAEGAQELAERVSAAGALFIGPMSAEAIGDYVAGSSHVLPTGATARFSSGLSALNFMKRTTVLQVSEEGMRTLGPLAMTLADAESLTGHSRSIKMRMASLARNRP